MDMSAVRVHKRTRPAEHAHRSASDPVELHGRQRVPMRQLARVRINSTQDKTTMNTLYKYAMKTTHTPGPLTVTVDSTNPAPYTVTKSHGHQPNAEQAGVGHSSATARCYHKADAVLYSLAPELLEALRGLETAFDKWYCDSGHLCALLDGMKKEDASPEMQDEVIRLQNLLVMSIKARSLITKYETTLSGS
jgi:hypothetical protein